MIGFYISGHPLDVYENEIKTFASNKLNELSDNMEAFYKEKGSVPLNFVGIITEAREGQSKTGKRQGFFTLEDKYGDYRFALFGQDYLNYSKFLKEGLYVYLRGSVVERVFTDKNTEEKTIRYDFKISKMDLLEDMFKTYSKGVVLSMNVEDVDEAFIKDITSLTRKNSGTAMVSFRLFDSQYNISSTLQARKHKVDVHNFLQALKPMIKKDIIKDYKVEVTRF